jgi:hypothetical protein
MAILPEFCLKFAVGFDAIEVPMLMATGLIAKCAISLPGRGGQVTAKENLTLEDIAAGERIRTIVAPMSTPDQPVSAERKDERRDFHAFDMLKPA